MLLIPGKTYYILDWNHKWYYKTGTFIKTEKVRCINSADFLNSHNFGTTSTLRLCDIKENETDAIEEANRRNRK